MLKLEKVHIEEFRGIRRLDLTFDSDNFGICGPNGTGKSGVVDAIEFCLTGDVTRLSGPGTADLSVPLHAPHVDIRKAPEQSKVRITATIPSLKKKVTIERSVGSPRQVTVTPADQALQKIVEEVESHPEFALSRREIVKYIITPAGQRAKDVQTLLRLDELDQIRAALTRIDGDCKKEVAHAEARRASTRTNFLNALNLKDLDLSSTNLSFVLQAINERRSILGLRADCRTDGQNVVLGKVRQPPRGREKHQALSRRLRLLTSLHFKMRLIKMRMNRQKRAAIPYSIS